MRRLVVTFGTPSHRVIVMADSDNKSIALIGHVLGPLFLYDPISDEGRASLGVLASNDPSALSRQWPFGDAVVLDECFEGMAAALDGCFKGKDANRASDDASLDSLTWEFRRLFVGPALKAAPPWGSVYLDKDGVLFGTSTLRLREWLRAAELTTGFGSKEPEDHIGIMLLLMAWLAENRPKLLAGFLADHLMTWAPHFLKIVERESTEGFYGFVARLTRESLNAICACYDIRITKMRLYR